MLLYQARICTMHSVKCSLVLAAAAATISLNYAHAQEKLGTLLIAGDVASCVKPHDGSGRALSDKKQRERDIKSGRATMRLVVDQIRKSKVPDPNFPVAVLGLGDLAYDCGTVPVFRRELGPDSEGASAESRRPVSSGTG
jgi:hypothetical protein